MATVEELEELGKCIDVNCTCENGNLCRLCMWFGKITDKDKELLVFWRRNAEKLLYSEGSREHVICQKM